MGYDEDDPRGAVVRRRLHAKFYHKNWPTDPAESVRWATGKARSDFERGALGGGIISDSNQ